MSNTKQTAVEWLLMQINNPEINNYFAEEIEQAKQMEKEQIIDAHLAGQKQLILICIKNGIDVIKTLNVIKDIENGVDTHDDGIDYYTQTYEE